MLHEVQFDLPYLALQIGWQYEGALLFGHVYRVKGSNQQALEKYREAELICKSSTLQESNLAIDAIIYQQLCLSAVGKYTEALKTLESLSKHSFTGSTEATFLYTLGCVYRCTGSFQKAEEALTASIKIATDLNSKADVFLCKAELGRVYRATGDFSKALELQKSFYDHALNRGDIAGTATACSLMGFTLQYHKDSSGYPNFGKAVQFLAAGMQLSHELGDTENIGWCLNNIAKAYIKSKKYKEALGLCKQRLQIAKETRNIVGEGTAYGNAGLACRGLGQFQDAVQYHKSYLDIVQKPLDKAWMEHEIALDYLAIGCKGPELSSALQFALKELITNNEIQLQYAKPADKEKIANFDKNHARCFNLLQYILVQQGRIEEALVVADMGRAQAVADVVVQKSDNHTNSLPTATDFVLPSGDLNATQISKSLKGIKEVVNKLQTSLVLYSVVDPPLPEKRSTMWLYIWVVNPNSPSVYFTQQILMPADQMGFDLLLGNEKQYFSELKVNAVKDHRDILLVKAKESQSQGSHSSLVEQVNMRLAHFYDILISPIENFLSDQTSRIIFIPHRFLLTIPYPALYDTKRYLVERFTVSVALSSFLLQLSISRLTNSDSLIREEHLLAVGNPLMPREDFPQLKGASEEADAVVKAFSPERSTILCEAEATKETVCKCLPLSKIAHFATHAFQQEIYGSDNSRDISYSDYTMKGGMVLAKSSKECSGILTSLEVQEMYIPAELVVLSCCKTAQGRITHDGTLGLSRAFICAGASAVIVTLWSIDDESTVTLMRKFYQHYRVSHDAATSLQNAMEALRAEDRGPGYWGAFCLVGITPGQLKILHSH